MKTQTFIGTPATIRQLTNTILRAAAEGVEGQVTYLKMVVGTTIHELSAKAPKTATRGRQPKLSPEQIQAQLAALDAVNDRFYPEVLAAASADLPNGRDKAKELNRRTNFARSAVSTIRGYIKAGNDITRIAPAACTKRSLQVERAARPPSAARMRKRVETRSIAFVGALLELAETDKAAAREELETLMGQLAHQLIELGGAAVREAPRPGASPEEMHRVFVPVTETQLLRQQARPS
jgi:hypothetical protein